MREYVLEPRWLAEKNLTASWLKDPDALLGGSLRGNRGGAKPRSEEKRLNEQLGSLTRHMSYDQLEAICTYRPDEKLDVRDRIAYAKKVIEERGSKVTFRCRCSRWNVFVWHWPMAVECKCGRVYMVRLSESRQNKVTLWKPIRVDVYREEAEDLRRYVRMGLARLAAKLAEMLEEPWKFRRRHPVRFKV